MITVELIKNSTYLRQQNDNPSVPKLSPFLVNYLTTQVLQRRIPRLKFLPALIHYLF